MWKSTIATETHHTNNNGDIFDNMANSEQKITSVVHDCTERKKQQNNVVICMVECCFIFILFFVNGKGKVVGI